MKSLNTLTKCIEKCTINQNVEISNVIDKKIHIEKFKIKAERYRKNDFENINFDKLCLSFIKDKSLLYTKRNFPEFSIMLYRKGSSIKNNIKELNSRIISLCNKLISNDKHPNILLINLKIFKLLFDFDIELNNTFEFTNFTLLGMNIIIVDEKIINNNIIIYSNTKRNQKGVYSVINNKRKLFDITCIGDFNQGIAFKYNY